VGAFNKALSSGRRRADRGFVAVSGGNHAQAVAYVASALGLPSIIVMPESTPRNYVEATRGYGAQVVFAPNAALAFERVASYAAEGWVAIHPSTIRWSLPGKARSVWRFSKMRRRSPTL